MTRLVRIPLDDGDSIVVEADDSTSGDGMSDLDDGPVIERVGRGTDAARHGAETLQAALARVQPALSAVVGHVRGLAVAPARVTVEFGIKVSAEAGVIVARSATEANFTIKAEWARETAPPEPDES